MAVLSVNFAAVLFAADDVLLLNLQDKLENEVYGNASSLELRRDGTLSLDELDFLHDGVMLAVYNNDGTLIAGLKPVADAGYALPLRAFTNRNQRQPDLVCIRSAAASRPA